MVDLQSTNRVKLSKVRESTFGVTPASPAFKTRRATSHGLGINPQTVTSNEIRADRQVPDLILVAFQSGGTSGGEASFHVMDDDLEEAVQGTWSATPSRDNAGTADSVITQVTAASHTFTHLTGVAFVAGQLVLCSGFGQAANNGVFKCTTGGTTTSIYAGATLADEAAPAANARMKVVGFQGASGDLAISGSTLTSSTLDFTTLGLVPGMWIKLAGFATTADNEFVRIASIAAHTLTFDRTPANWMNDAGTSVVISAYGGDFLVNGSTKRSNTFERQYLDQSPVGYELLTGQTLDKLSLTIPIANIVTFSEDWLGAGGTIANSRVAGATDIAAPTNDVLNSSTDIGRIGFSGANVIGPNFVQQATLDIANNLRRQQAVGHVEAVGIGNGEFTVTGTLTTYFGDKTGLDKLIANTLTSFDCRIGGADVNSPCYVLDLPSIKLSSGSPGVSGKNADVMLPFGYQAIADATLGYTIGITRFEYVA